MKNNKIKMIAKVSAIAVISSCIYISGINQTVYAMPNENQKIESRTTVQTGTILECDFLNIRSGASSKSSIVSKAYTNDKVEILEKNSNGWYKVKLSNGTTGWASGKYIAINNTTQPATNNEVSNKAKAVVDLAHKQIGKPYKWGANGPSSFDCSGLTSYVYKNGVGKSIPRSSKEQAKFGKTVSKSELQQGDLVFFATSGGRTVSHVGIYIGDSKMIHSPSSGKNVKIDSINSSYYASKFVTAKRVL